MVVFAPTYDCVEFVNEYLCSLIPGKEKLYLSADSMCKDEMSSEENAQIYTTEFLSTVSCSGLPSHRLKLKENVPVMLIRNIDQARGLCNGTRLQVVRMGTHVLSCKVLSGKNTGDVVFIPRMTLDPSNSTLPIKFQMRQFPLMISFAMTINKSQGQTLSHVGLYLPKPVFSHGQLYVALSRVKSRSDIKILIKSESGGLSSSTSNVVYKEVFMAKMMTSLARAMGLMVAQPAATVTTVLYYSDLLPRSVDFDRYRNTDMGKYGNGYGETPFSKKLDTIKWGNA
ncbi:PREDICTED: ATP-dependent DNA helicase PIF1-like [Erythranthe guttata]|uniref:ATP-dependent DNA helicase PIF1-like n=1 Tax=Erythranthe guttata TaxID=4155 RepID=UPI00064D7EF8|nr:PREDICTED: ATP-dependent DNA helicase PIF1-like [Erythranthe guttata]|eukprot:XP_012850134.1 PREDICTED: ATP-dependent DNA helicase PIF1-like [Erythranthe guttata]